MCQAKVLSETLVQGTEEKVSDEQGKFRKGKDCVDEEYAMKMLVEE